MSNDRFDPQDAGSPPGTPGSPGPSGREEVHLKLLASLRASAAGGELGVVRRLATWIDSPRVLSEIAAHPPWFEDFGVKEAFVRNEHTPETVRSRCAQAVGVLDLLRELDDSGLTWRERDEVREQIRVLIRAMPPEDRERVKERAHELSASRHEIGHDLEPGGAGAASAPSPRPETAPLSASDLRAMVSGSAGAVAPAAPPAAAEEPARPVGPVVPIQKPTAPDEIRAEEGRSVAISGLPLDRKAALARTTRDLAVLQVLSLETEDAVRLALLANPALGDRLLADVARTSSPAVAREIYRNRRLFQRPMVRRALLESPHVPSAALVEVVSSMGDLRGLLGLTQNPKIRSIEVKARARARLTALFRGLGSAEKIATVRASGSTLLKALWDDFFRDEELVLRCLRECHLDKGLVVEIAHSSIAPRRALKLIGETPSLSGPYEVRIALAKNPKTPRSVARRMLAGLRPEDRRELEGLANVS